MKREQSLCNFCMLFNLSAMSCGLPFKVIQTCHVDPRDDLSNFAQASKKSQDLNSSPLMHGNQISHHTRDYDYQISSSPGRQRYQMSGVRCARGILKLRFNRYICLLSYLKNKMQILMTRTQTEQGKQTLFSISYSLLRKCPREINSRFRSKTQ